MRKETVKPMPQAIEAGNMSRTRSPLGIANGPMCVDSHAVAMMPSGLPTNSATMMAMTTGETSNIGVIESKCTPVAKKAKMGNASNAENGCSLSAYRSARGECSPYMARGGREQSHEHAGQCRVHAGLVHHHPSQNAYDGHAEPWHLLHAH